MVYSLILFLNMLKKKFFFFLFKYFFQPQCIRTITRWQSHDDEGLRDWYIVRSKRGIYNILHDAHSTLCTCVYVCLSICVNGGEGSYEASERASHQHNDEEDDSMHERGRERVKTWICMGHWWKPSTKIRALPRLFMRLSYLIRRFTHPFARV